MEHDRDVVFSVLFLGLELHSTATVITLGRKSEEW